MKQKLAKSFSSHLLENIKERKVYSSFKDNIWSADLADMQSISKHKINKIQFLPCVIETYSKQVSEQPLDGAKGITLFFFKNRKLLST